MRSHRLRAAAGGGSGATDLASFFGVDSTASTTVRFQHLDDRYDCGHNQPTGCLLYTSPSPRDRVRSRMPSSA